MNLSYKATGLEALENNGPRILLAEHHRCLRRAGDDLLAFCHVDDCRALVAEYRIFERQVLEHMSAEEELVLPAFAEVDPAEAAAVLEAHAALRKHLEQTALDVELHSVRIGAIQRLLVMLDQHATLEDQQMYPWAQVHLPTSTRDAIGTRMLASLRNRAKLVG